MMKDTMLRGLMADGTVNITAVSAGNMVEQARKTHALSRVCTAALGRTLMGTAMMAVRLKHESASLSCIIKGGGPAGNIVCVGRPDGTVKGYIENPGLELPPGPDGKLNVSAAVGWFGDMTVIKNLYMKEPYIGRCKLVSGEIAEDFAQYFTLSEQQPSLVYLGVRVDAVSGRTLAAGGLIIQPLPQCPAEVLDALQSRVDAIKSLAVLLERGVDLNESLSRIFEGVQLSLTHRSAPLLSCDCGRHRLEQALISLGREELEDMMEKDHGTELTCHFCNKKYSFSEEDLKTLLAESTVSGDGDVR